MLAQRHGWLANKNSTLGIRGIHELEPCENSYILGVCMS